MVGIIDMPAMCQSVMRAVRGLQDVRSKTGDTRDKDPRRHEPERRGGVLESRVWVRTTAPVRYRQVISDKRNG